MTAEADFDRDVTWAAIQQAFVLAGVAFLLGQGRFFLACLVAAAAHWIAVGLIAGQRRSAPTPLDRFLIRYGFPPLLAVTLGSIPAVRFFLVSV